MKKLVRGTDYTHNFGVIEFLHETRLLLYTRNTKRLNFSANSVYEIVVWDGGMRNFAFNFGIIWDALISLNVCNTKEMLSTFKSDGLVKRL